MGLKEKLQKKLPLALASLIIIVILVGLDQWTKWAVVQSIPLYEKVPVIDGFFDLTYLKNTGMAFSLFEDSGMIFFIVLTAAALAAMVYYFFKTDDLGIELCLAVIAAGAIGNLIDRVSLGYVRDFFLFYIFGWPFPVFNVADICITCGFIGLIVVMFMDDWKERKQLHGIRKDQ